jgi:hypothetical protein
MHELFLRTCQLRYIIASACGLQIQHCRIPRSGRYIQGDWWQVRSLKTMQRYVSGSFFFSTTGFANHRKPMFTNFSGPLLNELFTLPYGTWLHIPFFYEYLVEVVLITLLLVPFLTLLGCGLFKLLARLNSSKRPQKGDRRLWTFSSTYLAFIGCTTVSHRPRCIPSMEKPAARSAYRA